MANPFFYHGLETCVTSVTIAILSIYILCYIHCMISMIGDYNFVFCDAAFPYTHAYNLRFMWYNVESHHYNISRW